MAIILQEQRRPLTTIETRDADPLSARFYSRLAHNANNLKVYATKPMLIMQHWPGGLTWSSGSPRTIQWPQLPFPDGFTSVRFVVGWQVTSGGGETMTARLYARVSPQVALPATTDSSAAVTTVSVSHVFTAGSIAPAPRFSVPAVSLLLYLTASAGGQGRIYTIKAWCS